MPDALDPTLDEQTFLRGYDPAAYPQVAVAVDIALLTIRAGQLQVLLVERGAHPFQGSWALPGGFVRPDEDSDAAAARVLTTETGLTADDFHLEQLKTYSDPDRDPRMRVFSVGYVAFAPDVPDPVAGPEAANARFLAVADLGLSLTDVEDELAVALAFDHGRIITDAVERARAKLEYTTLATSFLTAPFTLGDLRRIYEAVWGRTVHPGNFHRKALAADGFVEPTDQRGAASTGRGRPAQLYRPGPATVITPPLTRPE